MSQGLSGVWLSLLGVPVSADTILRSDYRGLAAWLAAADSAAAAAPPAADSDAGPQPMAEDTADAAAASDDARAAVREHIMRTIMDEHIFHARTEVVPYCLRMSCYIYQLQLNWAATFAFFSAVIAHCRRSTGQRPLLYSLCRPCL